MIRQSQYGFMQGKYFLTNVLAFLQDATGTIAEMKQIDIVYLGFPKGI